MVVDIRPFWMIAGVCSGGFGALVLTLRKKYVGYLGESLTLWGSSYLCFGAVFGMFVIGQRLGFSFYVLSRTMGTLGLCLELLAISKLKKHPISRMWMIVPPLIMLALGSWLTYGHRNISIEVLLFHCFNMVILSLCAREFLLAEDGKRQLVDVVAGVFFGGISLATMLLSINIVQAGRFPVEFDANSPRMIYNTVATIVAECVIFALFLLAMTERLNSDLRQQASHDSLTNLLNRRAFVEIGAHYVSRAARTHHQISVLMMDLDCFKVINDTHGHAIGDFALRSVADALRRSLRSEDYLCRWGGDEFCALLPGASQQDAARAAQRALASVAELEILVDGKAIRLQTSIGIASRDGDLLEFEKLMDWADEALYQAKENGRNTFAHV